MGYTLLTWRDVFDSYKVFGVVNTIFDMPRFLSTTGYNYFAWNGIVYRQTLNYSGFLKTRLTVDDLDQGTAVIYVED